MIRQSQRAIRIIGVATAILVVLLSTVFAMSAGGAVFRWDLMLTEFMITLGALACGAITGFFFGLPRARTVDQLQAPAAPGMSDAKAPRRSGFLMNSNLVKVSDWITTIIVGLGLANLAKVVPAARQLAGWLKKPLGGFPYSTTIGLCSLIAGLVLGFILTYVWTSTQVRMLFEELESKDSGAGPDLMKTVVDD